MFVVFYTDAQLWILAQTHNRYCNEAGPATTTYFEWCRFTLILIMTHESQDTQYSSQREDKVMSYHSMFSASERSASSPTLEASVAALAWKSLPRLPSAISTPDLKKAQCT